MKIAIDCCDLDHSKIDGTRVYIKNVLDRLGALAPNDRFFLYHQKDFEPLLTPKMHPNYVDRKIPYKFFWTQTRLAFELKRDMPDVLWMPIQQIPLLASKEIKSVVTIHDLAWKIFPENYERINRMKLDFFAQTAIKKASKLIAVSESTKNDILKFYPKTDSQKIKVIHHGFDAKMFSKKYSSEEVLKILKKYGIINISDFQFPISNQNAKDKPSSVEALKDVSTIDNRQLYILYVGGLDEKENLGVLIEAFEKLKNKSQIDNQKSTTDKLVLVGNDNDNSQKTKEKIAKSQCNKDICVTGRVDFDELVILYQNASVLVLPSKYEGFGITILEGFSSKIPVVTADNSSLVEVGGDAVICFDGDDPGGLANTLQKILENPTIREEMIRKGAIRANKFSWEKCAMETLEALGAN